MSKALAVDVSVDMFTKGQVSKGFDVPVALEQVREAAKTSDRVRGAVMWNAALLTWDVLEVHRDRWISADPSEDQFKDQTDYVVRGLKFGKGYGTTLKRLGRAIMVHGVTQGSAEWSFLASNAQLAPVGKAVALEDTAAFKAEIKRLAAEMREHGSITTGAREPRPASESDQSGDVDTQNRGGNGTATGDTVERVEATLDQVLSALDTMLRNADRETFAAAENRLTAMLTREVTIRAKADKGE